jgi:hypothetical protein
MSGNDDDMMDEGPIADDMDASEEFFEEGSFDDAENGEEGGDAEDWESYDGEFTADEGENAEALTGKKKKSTNMIVIGAALLIGFGILMVTVLHNQSGVKPAGRNIHGTLPGVVDTAPKPSSTTVAAGQAKPAGLLNDPQALQNLPQTINEAESAAPVNAAPTVPDVTNAPAVAPSESAAPVAAPDAVAPPMPAVAAPTPNTPEASAAAQPVPTQPALAQDSGALTPMPTPMPMSTAQPEGNLTAPMPEPSQLEAQPAASATSSLSAANEGAMESGMASGAPAKDEAMEVKLTQLLNRMDAVESKLAGMEQQPAAADLQSMQQTLSQISDRLDKIEAQAHAVSAPSSRTAASSESVESRPRKAAAHVPASRSAAEKSAVRWVLRSAQPGQAYVSRPGQADMISVHVGDTLPGIGRVTAIETEAGRWVIQGSQGSVLQ